MLLLALRIVKLLAVCAAFAGTAGAFVPEDLVARRRAVFWLGAPGIGAAWAFGFFLAAEQGVSLLQGYLLAAMLLSFFSLQVLLWTVAKEGRRSGIAAALAVVPLCVTLVLMVLRPLLAAPRQESTALDDFSPNGYLSRCLRSNRAYMWLP